MFKSRKSRHGGRSDDEADNPTVPTPTATDIDAGDRQYNSVILSSLLTSKPRQTGYNSPLFKRLGVGLPGSLGRIGDQARTSLIGSA